MRVEHWFYTIPLRLRSLFRSAEVEKELNEEFEDHLRLKTEQYMASGMTAEEARRGALRDMEGLAQRKEKCRDMRRMNLIENLKQDLRYTLRTLAQSPGFAVVMVITLALAIGANSAIFSAIRGVMLRELPYAHQERLVRFFLSSASYPKFPVNAFDFLDFRARTRLFESMAIMTRSDVQLSEAGEPQRLTGFRVSAGYFQLLGIHPERGRDFDRSDELPGHERVAIISDRLWRTRFHADPNILGAKIRLEARAFTVVGVMTPAMQHPGNEYRPVPYGDSVDVWWPFTFEGKDERGSHYIEAIGRLKPGISPAAGNAELTSIMAQLAREHPDGDSGWQVLVVPIYEEIVGSKERMLLVLVGAVGLVLLIACANAANLLLARATSRRREIAVRLALGASRGRLIRQMLTESLVLAVLGGVGAALIAILGVRTLVAMLPADFPRAGEIHVDLAVFAFTLLVALATGIIFGFVPAFESSRADVHQNLREGGRSASGSARQLRVRNWLVVSEVGLACVLLIGAGLLLRSFVKLAATDPGFRAERVLTASVALPEETYKGGPAILRFYNELLARLESLPGVHAAGVGSDLPWTGYDDNLGGFQIEGKRPPPHQNFHARFHMASPDYFRALGIPLLKGRFFNDDDNMKTAAVLIINRAMAERYWPGENVVGKRINFFEDHPKEKDWTTIVGVVGDVKDTPQKAAAEPAFWWPIPQTPFGFANFMITVRANTDPAGLVSAVRSSVARIDPTLAVADVRLMQQISQANMTTPRVILTLVGLFAALAIILAAIGTYGVISYSVNQRMHEFGMRTALGASPWNVLSLVLSQGLKLAAGGVLIGVISALALARVLRTLLYEVSATDPLTFGVVAISALAIATLACYLPARRATAADPIVALRTE